MRYFRRENYKRFTKRFSGGFLAIGFVAFAAHAASAADAILEPPPQPPEPVVEQVLLWTGPYIGAYGGYSWLDPTLSPGPETDSIHGATGGGYVGYNFQFDNNWVTGVEAMGGFSGVEDTVAGYTIKQDWEASLRGRLGYAFENSMLYGLAGLGATKAEVTLPGGSDSNVHLGWNIGAGLETYITDNVTARVEYDFSDYQSQDYNLGGGPSTGVDFTGHAVKLGVGVKF